MRFKKAQKIFTAADNPVTQSTESNLPLMLAEIKSDFFPCNQALTNWLQLLIESDVSLNPYVCLATRWSYVLARKNISPEVYLIG